jgi:Zn-dependent protease
LGIFTQEDEKVSQDSQKTMIKPAFVKPTDHLTTIGQLYATPIVVKGLTGLPVLELVSWVLLSLVAARKHPGWSAGEKASAGALTTLIVFGAEWCHNLAHTLVANRIGKPVDTIRIAWGTPLLIYYDINDQQVSPRQHILRASGGPIFNALMVPICWFIRQRAREGTLSRYCADFALGSTSFIATVSLLPIPGIDGGPILKWSMVRRGCSVAQADEAVKKVNLATGSGLGIAAGVAFKHKRIWLGTVIALFAAISLAIGLGYLKEQK